MTVRPVGPECVPQGVRLGSLSHVCDDVPELIALTRQGAMEAIGHVVVIAIVEQDHRWEVEMHANSVALHFMYYNFVKIHQSLRTTPAQVAGVTDRLWEIDDLVGLLD